MLDYFVRHCSLLEGLGWDDEFTPKFHLMLHLTLRMERTGNAWGHACFWDEALNKLLRKATRYAHAANFESIVFTKLTDMLDRESKRQKRN